MLSALVFAFAAGLTERWAIKKHGSECSSCPGIAAGHMNADFARLWLEAFFGGFDAANI